MKKLPIVEEFYSLQGEGLQTGRAAYFVRIGGCDVGCSWCDEKRSWNADNFDLVAVDDVVDRITKLPVKAVVATGGEPMMSNLTYFCERLKMNGVMTFLETSGSHPLSGEWDWICLSPKRNSPPLEDSCKAADELKVVIQHVEDFAWAEENAKLVSKTCALLLQPEWSRHKEITPVIIDYILKHPRWRISIQCHKFMNIP